MTGRRALLKITSGLLSGRVLGQSFTVFDYGVWCTVRIAVFHPGFFSPTLIKCLVTNASSFDRLTFEMYV